MTKSTKYRELENMLERVTRRLAETPPGKPADIDAKVNYTLTEMKTLIRMMMDFEKDRSWQ